MAYRAGGLGSSDATKVEVELVVATNDAVRACLSAKGFEYPTPKPESVVNAPTDIGNVEWTRKCGFGISTLPPPTGPGTDPLVDYLASLSSNARSAFDAALGRQGSGGCLDIGDANARQTLGIADLDKRFASMPSPLADADMQHAEAVWRTCVANAGVTAANLPDLIRTFATRTQAVAGSPELLKSLQQEEVRTAVRTFDCNASRNHVLASVIERQLVAQAGSG